MNGRQRMADNKRLTYRSFLEGDYGLDMVFREYHEIIHKVTNRLGQYEDIGTVEELRALIADKGKEAADGT